MAELVNESRKQDTTYNFFPRADKYGGRKGCGGCRWMENKKTNQQKRTATLVTTTTTLGNISSLQFVCVPLFSGRRRSIPGGKYLSTAIPCLTKKFQSLFITCVSFLFPCVAVFIQAETRSFPKYFHCHNGTCRCFSNSLYRPQDTTRFRVVKTSLSTPFLSSRFQVCMEIDQGSIVRKRRALRKEKTTVDSFFLLHSTTPIESLPITE